MIMVTGNSKAEGKHRRSHARTAIGDDRPVWIDAGLGKGGIDIACGFERAVAAHELRIGNALGAWNMTRPHAGSRLRLAAGISSGRARIDELFPPGADSAQHVVSVFDQHALIA